MDLENLVNLNKFVLLMVNGLVQRMVNVLKQIDISSNSSKIQTNPCEIKVRKLTKVLLYEEVLPNRKSLLFPKPKRIMIFNTAKICRKITVWENVLLFLVFALWKLLLLETLSSFSKNL